MNDPMSKRVPQLLVALVAVFGAIAIAIAVLDRSASDAPANPNDPVEIGEQLSPEDEAVRSADRFLDSYVRDDGRVERDEGDIVSEGQAYAMLLSVAVDDADTFESVWDWTRTNLMQPSGTLAWKWQDGRIIDPNAATDADLDAARALFMAAERFDRRDYHDAGVALADSLADENVVSAGDTSVLAAGPWATEDPYTWNPSYIAPAAFDVLAAGTGDPLWTTLRSDGTALLSDVTDNGVLLPSDWARLDGNGNADVAKSPDGASEPAFGFDAFRTLPRLSEACDAESRDLAAALVPGVERALDASSQVTDLDGNPVSGDSRNPLFLLAAAAGNDAAGNGERANELADEAERVDAASPSYYLGAWVALTRLIIDTDRLDVCSDLSGYGGDEA